MSFSKKGIIKYITDRRQNDGGFHFANIAPSSGADTFYATAVLTYLGHTIEKPETIFNFFESLAEERETSDPIGLYFTIESLKQLGFDNNKLKGMFEKINVSKEFDPNNKNKEIFGS